MSNEWTVVTSRREKKLERIRIPRGPRLPPKVDLATYLRENLAQYGQGRFKTVTAARDNLLILMSGGLTPRELSCYEVGMLQQEFGSGDTWYTKLGYDDVCGD